MVTIADLAARMAGTTATRTPTGQPIDPAVLAAMMAQQPKTARATAATFDPSRLAGLVSGRAGATSTPGGVTPFIDPSLGFTHPAYTGTDAGYAAWLATANQQQADAIAQAKVRRGQLEDAYKQALADLDRQSVLGRRNIQTNMLSRGLFHSGETNRRQSEYDAQINQAQQRANSARTQQEADVDFQQQNTLSGLSSQAATQVSQAMMRDALAAYQAQQDAAASTPAAGPAPPAFSAPPPSYAPPAYKSPSASTSPTYVKPTTNQAGIDPRFIKPAAPKPKPAVGSTGHLVQARPGTLQ